MRKLIASTLIMALALSSCELPIPKEALELPQRSLEQRQAQTRRYDTTDEKKLLTASAAVLQDLGFSIDESETKLGLVVSSKDRDATETGQIVGAVVLGVLFGVNAMRWDKNQKIRASLVTRPVSDSSIAVRITFQRTVWDQRNQISKIEALDDVKLYQEFFDRLSQSVFLTAQEI